jgi:hypothetical protein
VCHAAISAHGEFLMHLENICCVLIWQSVAMRVDIKRTAKALYRANLCRAAFAVRNDKKKHGKDFAVRI